MCATAEANTITGNLWHVPEAVSQNAVPANVPTTTPDVAFDVSTPFNFSDTDATVSKWLASSSAFDIVENTPGTLASLMDNGNQGTFLKFSGMVTVHDGQSFRVTHDDGLSLIINGSSLPFNPGPTSPTFSIATYLGPTGTFPFELDYGECCGGPAVLMLDLPFVNASNDHVPEAGGPVVAHVPESGAAFVLLGMGLLGLLGVSKQLREAEPQML